MKEFEPYEDWVDYGRQPPRRARILTPPSPPLRGLDPPYDHTGEDCVQAEIEQPSGLWATLGIHISRLLGNK